MDYVEKRKELERQFNDLKAERDRLVAMTEQVNQRLNQLQGQYQLLDELDKEVVAAPVEHGDPDAGTQHVA
jgi:hypothetical protein